MDDEKLISLVREYPILYDKSLSTYKDNDKKNNAWQLIAESIGSNFTGRF